MVEALAEIAARASTLTERLARISVGADGDATSEQRLELWTQRCAEGDRGRLLRRLARDGIELDAVRQALRRTPPAPAELPSWTILLEECVTATRGAATEAQYCERQHNPPDRCLLPESPLPFEETLVPSIQVARKRLARLAGARLGMMSDEAQACFERHLLERLTWLAAQTLYPCFARFRDLREPTFARVLRRARGDRSRDIYHDFLAEIMSDGLLAIFLEHPVLARLVVEEIDIWSAYIDELLRRLEQDFPNMREVFGLDDGSWPITSAAPALSDRHAGRSVALLAFRCGCRVLYKPKPLEIELAYVELIQWMNRQGPPLPLRSFKVMPGQGYGWAEEVRAAEPQGDEEAERYHMRLGMLLCIGYVLEATDLHHENIIGSGEHPILIDLETLMHPRVRADAGTLQSAEQIARQELDNSVLRTLLLPHAVRQSGLTPSDRSLFEAANTDTMTLRPSKPKAREREPERWGHAGAIIDGFRRMYRFFMEHAGVLSAPDGPLTAFRGRAVRFIFRPTSVYALVMNGALDPELLRDGAEWSIHLDVLSQVSGALDGIPKFWPLVAIERAALERAEAPIFYACSDSDALCLQDGQRVLSCFASPSFDAVLSRLRCLGEADLERQTELILRSLNPPPTVVEALASGPPDRAPRAVEQAHWPGAPRALEMALKLGEHLCRSSISGADGSVTWISRPWPGAYPVRHLSPMGFDLYDGLGGVAVFLSAVEAATGGAGLGPLALASLASLRSMLRRLRRPQASLRLGGARGLGSFLYAMARTGAFLADAALLDDAARASALATEDLLRSTRDYDVIDGCAGLLLGLLSVHRICGDGGALERAVLCGRRLLELRRPAPQGHLVWPTEEGRFLTGFSHGASGVCLALARLYGASGETAFRDAAREGMAWERSFYDPASGKWPDSGIGVQSRQVEMCSWCNGATGIGLSRIGVLDALDDAEILFDVTTAVAVTMRVPLASIESLCCGEPGRVELLLNAARRLGRPELFHEAAARAALAIDRWADLEADALYERTRNDPSLFQGVIGAGYEILRVAAADRVPSMLLWS